MPKYSPEILTKLEQLRGLVESIPEAATLLDEVTGLIQQEADETGMSTKFPDELTDGQLDQAIAGKIPTPEGRKLSPEEYMGA